MDRLRKTTNHLSRAGVLAEIRIEELLIQVSNVTSTPYCSVKSFRMDILVLPTKLPNYVPTYERG
jgi:hypothetical protein